MVMRVATPPELVVIDSARLGIVMLWVLFMKPVQQFDIRGGLGLPMYCVLYELADVSSLVLTKPSPLACQHQDRRDE